MTIKRINVLLVAATLWLLSFQIFAAVYSLPSSGGDVVGRLQSYDLRSGVNLTRTCDQFGIGYYELLEANPHLNPSKVYAGTPVTIPTQYILPQVPHEGIILNLAELRLYYFPPGQNKVFTAPVGIGRRGWQTPTGSFKIIQKKEDPTWFVPKSIAEDSARKGIILPKSIPPGPDNPLGKYALRLSSPSYLIHGTNRPAGVGRRVSSGCIRMRAANIKKLYEWVSVGTPVKIINQPFKAGWLDGELYFEAHEPLSEQRRSMTKADFTNSWKTAINQELVGTKATVDWQKASQVANAELGIPVVIGQAN